MELSAEEFKVFSRFISLENDKAKAVEDTDVPFGMQPYH